jgi:hypothetical protein
MSFSSGSRDSVVGIATCYGLEGPGIESRWGEIFRTYPDRLRGPPNFLYNGYRVFPGGKGGRGVMLTTHPLPVLRLKKVLSYTSTRPMGPPGPVTRFPLPFTFGSSFGTRGYIGMFRTSETIIRPGLRASPKVSVAYIYIYIYFNYIYIYSSYIYF